MTRRPLLPLLAAALLAVLVPFAAEVAARAHFAAPSPTPILTDRHGRFLAQLGHFVSGRVEYGYWPADQPPDRVVRATLALEDRRFWHHPGVDPRAVLRAASQDLSGRRPRSGASTLAMQIARMQHPEARTPWAKAVEAGTALALTWRYGRDAVLAHYFRLVPYGNGSHGIAHAARFYFDKPAGDLSWAEIALLSAVPQAPTLLNPVRPEGLARAKARARRVLAELRSQAVLSAGEHEAALAQLAAMPQPAAPRRPPDALHLIERARQMLAAGAPGPPDPADPRIPTSLDLDAQADIATLAREHLDAWRPAGAQQVAVLAVRRDTREVVAAIGSASYADPRGGAVDFTRAVRSPGSTLKPFIYALALERGALHPAETLDDRPEGAAGIANADGRFLGPLLPRQALANSRNVPAVSLLRRVGLDDAFGLLRSLGLHDADAPASAFGLSMAIGSLPTSLDRLVRAYGALADDGVLRDLAWYRGTEGTPARRVLSTDAAREVTLFLSDPLARLPSFPRYGSSEYPFAAALKTGTSQGYRDAWTVAWSGRWMVGVWVGRADAGPMAGLSGARAAASLARAVLLHLHGTRPGDLLEGGFAPPDGWIPVPLCAGAPNACSRTLVEWLPPSAVPSSAPDASAAPGSVSHPVHLAIIAPEPDSHLWRNPEIPADRNWLVLKAEITPHVPQIVWYVDGAPFALTDPDQPVSWPMLPGAHRFEVRLPLHDTASRPVRIVID